MVDIFFSLESPDRFSSVIVASYPTLELAFRAGRKPRYPLSASEDVQRSGSAGPSHTGVECSAALVRPFVHV